MAAPVLYFVGGEDFDFTSVGAVSVDTASSHRRTDYCRCALQAEDGSSFWATGNVMNVTSAWFHARVWMEAGNVIPFGDSESDHYIVRIADAAGITRLVIYAPNISTGSLSPSNGANWFFAKVNAAGTRTIIGAAFSGFFSAGPSSPDALDIEIVDYATGGSGVVNIYINGTLVFTASSQTLATDSNTTINELRLAGYARPAASDANTILFAYSEVIIADSDTRYMSLVTLTPAADGNTVNFDAGGVSNINETTLDDTTLNSSGSAGQVQQYTVGSLPAGNFGVVGLVAAARAMAGASGGPTKLNLGVRTGGSDYWSSDITLAPALEREQNTWTVNPDTGVAFTIAELGAAGFNIGMQSVA